MTQLISKAYSQISVDKAAALLGISSNDLLQGEVSGQILESILSVHIQL